MAKRRSIHIAGFKHGNPTPSATRLGLLLVSSVIVGRDLWPGQARPKRLFPAATST